MQRLWSLSIPCTKKGHNFYKSKILQIKASLIVLHGKDKIQVCHAERVQPSPERVSRSPERREGEGEASLVSTHQTLRFAQSDIT